MAWIYDLIFLALFAYAAASSWRKGFLAGLTELIGAVLGVGAVSYTHLVAIAGVIAMRPDCLVLDEATAMLDPHGRGQVTSMRSLRTTMPIP